MAKKDALPEISVSTGAIVDAAQKAVAERGRATDAKTKEDEAKKVVKTEAESIRQVEVGKGSFIGLIRIAMGESGSSRVEFRIENGAVDASEEAGLEKVLGAAMPELFERATVVGKINDLDGLLGVIRTAGLNPMDVLSVSVKNDVIATLPDAGKHVETATALLPKPGFLATVNRIAKTLPAEGLECLKKYLDQNLVQRMNLGSKEKGD